MPASPIQHWDIFCRVVDNFGDIGVSWRLARQLAHEHGLTVRLWVDQLAPLQMLVPSADAGAERQTLQGVEVWAWRDAGPFPAPGDVVIEAFGCGLPDAYVRAMTARAQPPLWIVLEYLSAESWVREHHGLPSPHPQLSLNRYFFFPGVTVDTGGLLREADLLTRRDAFDAAGARARRAWWSRLGFGDVPPQAITVSVFAYPHAPIAELIEACAGAATPTVMALPESGLASRVREHVKCGRVRCARHGNLQLRFIPFMAQAEYDALLWASDVNFVRGEDSFVRAQWAGRPFVWHIYPQAQDAHVTKLDAFLKVYGKGGVPDSAMRAMRDFWRAWNGVAGAPPLAAAWAGFYRELAAQKQGLSAWRDHLLQLQGLTHNLLNFCRKMV